MCAISRANSVLAVKKSEYDRLPSYCDRWFSQDEEIYNWYGNCYWVRAELNFRKMKMDAGIHCSKEMVDLLMRVKKHLKMHHQVTLSMSDSHVMERLLELATVKDDVLQGMMQYLMALAGGNWSARYLTAAGKSGGKTADNRIVKSLSSKLKDRLLSDTDFSGGGATSPVQSGAAAEGGAKIRYYRSQPVYS